MLRRALVILALLGLAFGAVACSDSKDDGDASALAVDEGSLDESVDSTPEGGDPAAGSADGGGSEDEGPGLGGTSDGGPDEYPAYCELVRNETSGFDWDLKLKNQEAMLAIAPDEIKDDHRIVVDDIKVMIAEKDDVNAPSFRSEEVLEADTRIISFDFEHCDL